MSIVADAACSADVAGLLAEHLRGGLDQVAGRGVERGDLVEHQLLVRERLGDDDRGAQRRHGRGRGAVDALDELHVVAPDEVQRQVALDAHGELGQQVLDLLSDREEQVLLERPGAFRIGRFDRGDPRGQPRVELLREVGVLAQPAHDRPEVGLLLLDVGVVLAQLVLTFVERGDDRVDVALAGLVLAEVVARRDRRTAGCRAACAATAGPPGSPGRGPRPSAAVPAATSTRRRTR